MKNLLFIWLPKTGGSTLNHMLADAVGMNCILQDFSQFKNRGSVTFGHASILHLLNQGDISRQWFDDAYKITFVRHPYTRIVSLWRYLMRIGHITPGTPFYQFINNIIDGDHMIGPYNVRGLSQGVPQTEWMQGIDFDFVGRYENYQEDVLNLCTEINYSPNKIPKVNANPKGQGSYMSAFCSDSLGQVREYYKRDFELLNYNK